MATFRRTVLKGMHADLCLYKVTAVSDIPAILPHGCIRLGGSDADQWKIGLRENVADAVERENRTRAVSYTHLTLPTILLV